MSITVNEKEKLFSLNTAVSTYQMKVNALGVLLHQYYGRAVGTEDMGYLFKGHDVGFAGNPYEAGEDRTFSLDTAPQEYSGNGVGDYRIHGLEVKNSDGTTAVSLRYDSYELMNGKYVRHGLPAFYGEQEAVESLVIHMRDEASGLAVDLWYGVWEQYDVITRCVTVKNEGKDEIHLTKAASMLLDLFYGDWELLHFHGRHCMERQAERLSLPHGRMSLESTRGASSHQQNPFAVLCAPDATEEFGQCIGIGLVYSGNFKIQFEKDQMEGTRAAAGIHEKDFDFLLQPGDEFETPEALLIYSAAGFSEMSVKLHRAVREHLIRGKYKNTRRPVLINNWEATYFGFNEKKILEIAEGACSLGVEMLVLDDGWFGSRDSDTGGLGDWVVNTDKLKGGLKPLVEKINALGMKFGLWFEPEMVSEDSVLYKSHPEWAVKIPGRKPCRGRFQLVLDMTREDVREYLYCQMCGVLDSANIEYVKWDMNRHICDIYSEKLPAARQGEFYHRYVLGVYELLEKLITRYPDILWEGCSGGGGRFDFGMLYYTPQIWCSDDTDAVERLRIQYGTSFAYPVSSMGSHVSAAPNHQTGRITPLETRGAAAMCGSFGYELDLNLLSAKEKQEVKEQIAAFQRYYDVIHYGDYYRLSSPFENEAFTAWQYVSQDKEEALVHAVITHVYANSPQLRVRLRGLNPGALYRIEQTGEIRSGAALMYAGVLLPRMSGDYRTAEFYLNRIELP